MKSVQIALDECRAHKLSKISEATRGNMNNIMICGESIEYEQRKLSATKIAKHLLNNAIDKAYAQLPG